MTSKSENIIHIKFEHNSALECKKDILSTEIDLLKMSQILKRYTEYRLQELEVKQKLERKCRALKLDIGRLQNLLPIVKVPSLLKEPHHKLQEVSEERVVPQLVVEKHNEVESQLQEIQRRLNSLQR